ncbi:PQQ-binding-like beta-propeller repeat protein [Sphingobium sp. LMA1-1-1.1]|uniref:outer membrane protein assembly factor BamB family protein n=1 Tax=Sphingobium sp. LMA1-1-1.1 TaxID=3135238 RepID=UPI00342E3E93
MSENDKVNFRKARGLLSLALLLSPSSVLAGGADTWSYFGGSHRFDRYSSLANINRRNVDRLAVVWNRPGVDEALLTKFPDLQPSPYFRGTPLIRDGILYAPNGVGLVEAFDAATGKTVWVQQPFKATFREAAGQSSRGVDVWGTGIEARVVSVRGEYLYALNLSDGSPVTGFGEGGRVSLNRNTPDGAVYFNFNGPIVVGDVIVVGGNGGGKVGVGYGDSGNEKEALPENIRGYDVRTGKLVWTFKVIPDRGMPGGDSWGGAEAYSGNMAAWAPITADDETGLVYVPLSAPTNPNYGGHRPGDNLYSNSLVALDAKTGRKIWHYQTVHHDLWDFDNVSPPVLADFKTGGRTVKAVIQANKTGYIFVLDRATGKPVWPINERPVPPSTVPGEHASPTQPFPSRPEPVDRIGLADDDLIDFTPALREEAMRIRDQYVHGPLFTPPTVNAKDRPGTKGTISSPGDIGSIGWNTGAFDPETGLYYAVSMTAPGVVGVSKTTDPKATIDYSWDVGFSGSPTPGNPYGIGPRNELPLTKPPYGRITAIDMKVGRQVWMAANGEGPRNHPLLAGLQLPPLGYPGRPAALVTKSLLFVGEGSDAVFGGAGVSGESVFRAYDKATGKVVGEIKLPAGTTGGPITYQVKGRQMIVVPIGNSKVGGRWVALAVNEVPAR